MKNGTPINAVTTPIGVSAGFVSIRPGMSARIEERAAQHERQREQASIARSGHQADHMGDHQPDEADQTAHRHHRRRAERGRDHDDQPRSRHRHAERRRLDVTDPEQVELTAVHDQHDRTDHDVRQDQQDVRPCRTRQPAEHPLEHLAHHVVVALEDERLHRRRERHDGDPRQDERGPRATTGARAREAARRADRVGDPDGGECHHERRGRHRIDRPHRGDAPSRRQRDRGAEAGARRDPEQVRVDQRVPEHALIAGTGDRQHPTDETTEDHPRHADLPQDVPFGL